MRDTAFIYAERASVELPHFWKPTELIIRHTQFWNTTEEKIYFEVPQKEGYKPDEGFQFEILHVEECIRNGLKESPEVSWDVTERVLAQSDALRKQWGLKYPFE